MTAKMATKFILLFFVLQFLPTCWLRYLVRGGNADVGGAKFDFASDEEPFSDTFTCDGVTQGFADHEVRLYDPSPEFTAEYWKNYGPKFQHGGHGAMVTGYNVMKTVIMPIIYEFKVTACSLRKRILNATSHDILESYNMIEDMQHIQLSGWVGQQHSDRMRDLQNNPSDLWFLRHPNTNDLLESMRIFFCVYRTCNVGECISPATYYSDTELEAAAFELVHTWKWNLGLVDKNFANEEILWKLANDGTKPDDIIKDAIMNGDLLSFWAMTLAMLDRILLMLTFLENHPDAENFMVGVWYVTGCNCYRNYSGELCNICSNGTSSGGHGLDQAPVFFGR